MADLRSQLAAVSTGTSSLCDVVIAADVAACVYVDAFPHLIHTLCWLCDDCGATRVLIGYRRRFHTEDAFFDAGTVPWGA